VALAERIHAALVPPVAIDTPRFEAFGRAEPSSEVGGDLLDVVQRHGELVACVADVSGHGVSAGTFMGMVKSAFRMRLLGAERLDELLDDLNEVVRQIRSPEMFVTFAGARFDASQQAELALAGHLPILHYCSGTDAIVPIDNERPPLGVVARQRHVSSHVGFRPGDLFVFVTDGVTEVANARGEQFGIAGVERTIRQHVRKPLAEIYAAVLDAVRRHGPQTDDQTLLLVRAR
jgi:serine phosphatase RsbU (regulator of sigma subunit)